MRLIDADALIVEIKTCLWDWESVNGIKAKTVLNQTITDIGNMPTIDAVPVKHGEWIKGQFVDSGLKCPFCGFVPYDPGGCEKFNYCSNCGARMDGERKG